MYIIIRKYAAAASESALALVPCHVTAKMARLKFGKVVIALGHKRMRSRMRRRKKRRRRKGEGVSNNY